MSEPIPIADRRRMAIDEGSRVYVLVLRALIEELGVEGTNTFARQMKALAVDNEPDAKVRERLSALLSAATAHGPEYGPREDDNEFTVDRAWRDAQTVGARVYALALRTALDSFGPERARQLATKMDEVSVEGVDVFAVRPILGLPEKEDAGTIEDWINFMGTGWTVIADAESDWEWVDVSDTGATLRVHRCPYFAAMTPDVRAAQPCEQGCSSYLDTAAQEVHPRLRLRGDPGAVDAALGYAQSLPKGDGHCELTVGFADG